jgi:hypothetical protein
MKDMMFDNPRSRSDTIEARLAHALRVVHEPQGAFVDPPSAEPQTDAAGYSANELLQLAYDSVENEIEVLRKELRLLRQQHRTQEERLERRIIQKEALRRKIVDSATEPAVTPET